jgi:signal transduction histidine kinase
LRVDVGGSDHAPATAVHAVLEDRGVGASATSFTEGFGLRSLRGRAEALNGTLDAQPTDAGFRLSLALPVHESSVVEAERAA